MAWGRDGSRKIVKDSTKHDVELKIKEHQKRGWRQISQIQTEIRHRGAYAVLMEQNKKHA